MLFRSIDSEYIWGEFINEGVFVKNIDQLDKICEAIILNISFRIKEEEGTSDVLMHPNENYLILFKKITEPSWVDPVYSIFEKTEEKKENWFNQSSSFLLLSIIENEIYATTGGYASAYIKYFIVRNFGLNLLTKIFNEFDPVIKEVTENLIVGERHSVAAINRNFKIGRAHV